MTVVAGITLRFLPTPSARRATLLRVFCNPATRNFYPRPPRGGRRQQPRVDADVVHEFLPTPSARRATGIAIGTAEHRVISTHALREEGDTLNANIMRDDTAFLPTPSARRATSGFASTASAQEFLPTPSARRATAVPRYKVGGQAISTHALREEGDAARALITTCPHNFYPRPPRGGRQCSSAHWRAAS